MLPRSSLYLPYGDNFRNEMDFPTEAIDLGLNLDDHGADTSISAPIGGGFEIFDGASELREDDNLSVKV